jgi:hypothetical protein
MTNKVKLIDSCQYDRCLLGLKCIYFNKRSYILCTSTDGHLILYRLVNQLVTNDKKPIKIIKSIHQSGINSFDVWKNENNADEIMVASVGDDSSLSIINLKLNQEIVNETLIKLDMVHASSIMGKF